MLVLIFFLFIPAVQLVLVLVLFQKPIRSWKLVADVTHLLFGYMSLFRLAFILRPFARNGLSPVFVATAHMPCHVDLERKILARRSKV